MQTIIRTTEEELTRAIWGLSNQIAAIPDPDTVAARRAVSFMKQLMKSKLDQRATLRYRRTRLEFPSPR